MTCLIERAGEIVSRDELQQRVWGPDTVVDFDHSIGTAINKIRDALGDTADNPRFVETLAKRGYRFIAPVAIRTATLESSAGEGYVLDTIDTHAALPVSTTPHPESTSTHQDFPVESAALPSRKSGFWVGTACLVALLAGIGGFYAGSKRPGPLPRIERLTRTDWIAPGTPATESLPASATDGLRIFIPVISGGRSVLAQIDVRTGEVQKLPLPSEISSPTLGDLSPDGSTLLLRNHLSPESEQPLWTFSTGAGTALRLANVIAHDATWMPDGKRVLYAAGNRLFISRLEDGVSTPFATLPGRAFWLRWSPDGKILRFTLMDPVDHTLGLWETSRDGRSLRPILSSWTKPSSECCGIWTGDGNTSSSNLIEEAAATCGDLTGRRS